MKIRTTTFGENGANLYTLENDNGTVLALSDFGARIVNLHMQVKDERRSLVLGFDSAEEYEQKDSYIGATIGRVAGRLSGETYDLAGEKYSLNQNDGNNSLHGGRKSFDCRIWETKIKQEPDSISVTFSLLSPAGDNGYPGNLLATVIYALNNHDEWSINYNAISDATTLFNPTNHVYFNLNRDAEDSIGTHLLSIDADKFGVLTKELIPTGELRPVSGTPFDFRKENMQINQGLTSDYEQNKLVGGFDHPFLFNKLRKGPQVILMDCERLIKLEMITDAPAVVVYTSNMIEEPVMMRDSFLVKHGGVTLETQQLPDAINHCGFGSIILNKHEEFNSRTIFKLSSVK